jgi:hypothetical protein
MVASPGDPVADGAAAPSCCSVSGEISLSVKKNQNSKLEEWFLLDMYGISAMVNSTNH